MDFKNKVNIITVASTGIAEATAYHLARLSAKSVLTGSNEWKLKEVANKLETTEGIKPCVVKADTRNNADVKKIAYKTIQCFGQIEVLINNAGSGTIAPIKDELQHFDPVNNTNLRSVYLLKHLAAKRIIKTKGNIINVSSIVSTKPVPVLLPYCVSKAGRDMFTKCIAKDLAANGVRVNLMNPGHVTSEFRDPLGLGKKKTEELMKDREIKSPVRTITTREDVADLVVFLAVIVRKVSLEAFMSFW